MFPALTPANHYCSLRRLQRNNLSSSKTFSRRICKTSYKNVFKRSSRRLRRTSSRRFQDVYKMSSKRLQDVLRLVCKISSLRPLQDVFKRSSRRRLAKTSWKTKKCYTENVFKTSSRRLQYVFTNTKLCWDTAQKMKFSIKDLFSKC